MRAKKIFIFTFIMAILFNMTVFAKAGLATAGYKDDGTYRWCYLDENRDKLNSQWISVNLESGLAWCYADEDGYLKSNEWFQDSNGKWYYFNEWAFMLSATTTPDGYYVGADGAWVVNEVVQQQESNITVTETQAQVQETQTATQTNVETTVYWTPNGEKYHSTQDCSTLKRSKTILSGTISQSGRTPCKVCH